VGVVVGGAGWVLVWHVRHKDIFTRDDEKVGD